MKTKRVMFGLLLAAMFAVFIPQETMAVGTASNTDITNQATVGYQVGGVDQTAINSNITTFKVDNKVDLTVAEVSSASVVPGESDRVLAFTVTNTGNTTQGYSLTTSGGTDDFDMNSVEIYLDVNTNGTYESGTDTSYTTGNIADIAADGSIQVLIVADTPLTPTNGQTAVYNLIATTLDAGTTTVTTDDSGDADVATTVQVVFADGTGTDDSAEDGKHSADAVYTVTSSVVSMAKTATVIYDPINGATNPKRIPGAIIRYVITVSNAAGGLSATLTTITDALDTTNTAIDSDLLTNDGTTPESAAGSGFKMSITGGSRGSFPKYYTTTSSADGVDYASGTVTATMATVMPVEGSYAAGELKAGESITLTFNVIIQ